MALTSFPHISFTLEPIAAFANEVWHLGVATNEYKSLQVQRSLSIENAWAILTTHA